MKTVSVCLAVLASIPAVVGPALAAEPARPGLFEEAGRLVDQMAEQIRDFGSRMERQLSGRRGPMGSPDPAASPAERPLITMMLHHRAELGLTPDQIGRLEALRSDFAREAIRREADIRVAELDLAGLLAQNPVDAAKAEAKIREVAQLRADLRVERFRTIEQGKKVLTPEQRVKLEALVGSMHGPAMHGPGMGSGPGGPPRSAATPAIRL
jgi:Spy/CpxP family protein refolding chaperone